eukprot:TRINITY_DN404_c0_g1_i1.p1 TRINITY_DN404_c0_g1~~TRINITY_DN404_c0_g1_i1.p1  ORF type:complete len:196 (+),score=40.18 TRINITY_DN404_c0_g1_i1:125-712(+)
MSKHKLCILGDGGVGKTAFTIQFCTNQFVTEYDPTIEDSYRKQVVIDDINCMIEILDTAGQEEFKALRDQWIQDCEGFILVYAITSRRSFEQIMEFVSQVERVKDEDKESLQMILVGNKCDLADKRKVSVQEGEKLAQELHASFKEGSAKTRVNVEETFFDLVRKLRSSQGGGNTTNGKNSKPKKKESSGLCSLL